VARPGLVEPSNIEQAAMAFSMLTPACADVVNRRLTIAERKRLIEALSRVRTASDEERRAAMRRLANAVRTGIDWPRPASHDEADCPFNTINSHQRYRVVEVLDRVAQREPLQVVVTLCHLNGGIRAELWERLSPETHALIVPRLNEVHLVSTVKTKEYARDVNARLTRAIRASANGH
jgi:hypothetical protein